MLSAPCCFDPGSQRGFRGLSTGPPSRGSPSRVPRARARARLPPPRRITRVRRRRSSLSTTLHFKKAPASRFDRETFSWSFRSTRSVVVDRRGTARDTHTEKKPVRLGPFAPKQNRSLPNTEVVTPHRLLRSIAWLACSHSCGLGRSVSLGEAPRARAARSGSKQQQQQPWASVRSTW